MQAKFQVTGAQQLGANLIGVGRSVAGNRLEAAGLAGGRVIAKDAARRAPRDTGQAAESIDARIVDSQRHRVEIAIGPGRYDGWYLLFHEIGTSKMPARPFLRPAFDEKQMDALREARRVFRSNILAAIRRGA